jgi:hypothetical protein
MIEGTESLDDEVALDCVALQTVLEELESINVLARARRHIIRRRACR